MWKYITAFIIIIFLIAFIIGSNGEEPYEEGHSIVGVAKATQKNSDSSIAISINDQKQDGHISDTIGGGVWDVLMMETQTPHQLLTRIGYATSYNKETKCPNWVAWHLTAEHTDGPFPRSGEPYFENGEACGIGKVNLTILKGDYFVDMEIEESRPDFEDWSEMPDGISHGHMCPAGDNKWSKAAMNQSFLLTNMCPQSEKLNGGGWKKLEDKCREWAIKNGDIYIVAGPIFYNGVRNSFGKNKIGIPDAFFKVVLCVNGTPKAIGFIYSNDESSQLMKNNVRSVDKVEDIAGMDFFYSLPNSIEDEIESKCNLNDWK